MPRIVAAASAFPENDLPQTAVRDAVAEIFSDQLSQLPRMLAVFDHARIERRQFMMPLAWYATARSPVERNRVYLEQGLSLAAAAAKRCLDAAGMTAEQVDHIIAVSSTGHATPSLDARLINALGLPQTASRLPIWGLGCAGGAAGLARAFDHCRAHPAARVLLVALETCSLTFMSSDLSKKNLVGAAIFADGAAAVLIAGAATGAKGPRLLATRSHLFRNSYELMGWDFCDEGMRLVLSPRLPAVVKAELPRLVDGFLGSIGLQRPHLVHYLSHPGGAKVIDAYRQALGLDDGQLALTEGILSEHGNVSSVSVLAVLEKWLSGESSKRPGYGLLSAFGPGFSAEQILLEV